MKGIVRELAKAKDDEHISFANEISKLQQKVAALQEQLKAQQLAYKDLEKDKFALERTNEQVMKDYKNDLETLKQGMKAKASEDEILFKKLLDEKGNFCGFAMLV